MHWDFSWTGKKKCFEDYLNLFSVVVVQQISLQTNPESKIVNAICVIDFYLAN